MFFLFCILFTFLDNSLMLVFMFIIFPIESLDRCIDIDHTVSKCLSTHSFINGQHLYFKQVFRTCLIFVCKFYPRL